MHSATAYPTRKGIYRKKPEGQEIGKSNSNIIVEGAGGGIGLDGMDHTGGRKWIMMSKDVLASWDWSRWEY
jgi:hypothetical protein